MQKVSVKDRFKNAQDAMKDTKGLTEDEKKKRDAELHEAAKELVKQQRENAGLSTSDAEINEGVKELLKEETGSQETARKRKEE